MRHNVTVTIAPDRVALSLLLTGACRTKRGDPSAAQQWYFKPGEARGLADLLIRAADEAEHQAIRDALLAEFA